MRARRSREERGTATTASPSSPAEMISSGVAAGTWLLDSGASRVRVSLKRLRGLLGVREQFEFYGGMMEIGPSASVNGCLAVGPGSGQRRRYHEVAHGGGPHPWLDQVMVTFRSQHVLLLVPDQAWIVGTVTSGGVSASLAFEATVTTKFPGKVALDARIVGECLQGPAPGGRRRRPAQAVISMHLAFVRQS
jgi:hypothetical protein